MEQPTQHSYANRSFCEHCTDCFHLPDTTWHTGTRASREGLLKQLIRPLRYGAGNAVCHTAICGAGADSYSGSHGHVRRGGCPNAGRQRLAGLLECHAAQHQMGPPVWPHPHKCGEHSETLQLCTYTSSQHLHHANALHALPGRYEPMTGRSLKCHVAQHQIGPPVWPHPHNCGERSEILQVHIHVISNIASCKGTKYAAQKPGLKNSRSFGMSHSQTSDRDSCMTSSLHLQ